jgi:hypothetical protein
MKNKYGLSRKIPDSIKRNIRQRSGFGCVICGFGITEYEHVNPEFKNAREHSPNNITLLCPNHHALKTKKILSVETIREAMANPKALQVGYIESFFDIGRGYPAIQFSGSLIEHCTIPIMVKGEPIIMIEKDEEANRFVLSGQFYDSTGKKTLIIVRNEWRSYTANWDIITEQNRITIREKQGKIVLLLEAKAPDVLIIKKIDMLINGLVLKGDENQFSAGGLRFHNFYTHDNHIGFNL